MNKRIMMTVLVVALAGCKAPKTPGEFPPPEGDLAYLLDADPAAVTSAELLAAATAAQTRADLYHVADGVFWQAYRSDAANPPDLKGSGGDSLLFTGNYLAACSYRYGVTRSSADLDKAIEALRGIYILTHISGQPGALMRCAFQSSNPVPFQYPDHWGSRIARGFVYDSPTDLDDPFNPGTKFPQFTFYTRVTRDQVTGLAYGLAVFWEIVNTDDVASAADLAKIEQARLILAQTVEDVYQKFKADDWKILDHKGTNDTNSDYVSKDLLRLSFLSLYRKTALLLSGPDRAERVQEKYEDVLRPMKVLGFYPSDPFNRFSTGFQYYAWNLRHTRAAAVWLTADADDKDLVAGYIRKWMYRMVKNHKNAWFTLIHAVASNDADAAADGVLSLKSWSLRPAIGWSSPMANGYDRFRRPLEAERISGLADHKVLWPHLRKPTSYWTWQKGPWDAGATRPVPDGETGSLDMILPYWMARYHGIIQ